MSREISSSQNQENILGTANRMEGRTSWDNADNVERSGDDAVCEAVELVCTCKETKVCDLMVDRAQLRLVFCVLAHRSASIQRLCWGLFR